MPTPHAGSAPQAFAAVCNLALSLPHRWRHRTLTAARVLRQPSRRSLQSTSTNPQPDNETPPGSQASPQGRNDPSPRDIGDIELAVPQGLRRATRLATLAGDSTGIRAPARACAAFASSAPREGRLRTRL